MTLLRRATLQLALLAGGATPSSVAIHDMLGDMTGRVWLRAGQTWFLEYVESAKRGGEGARAVARQGNRAINDCRIKRLGALQHPAGVKPYSDH